VIGEVDHSMIMFLIVQCRNSNNIALWKVPAETREQAVFQLRMLDEHQKGDTYCTALKVD
jgi:hypothetical protein